MPAIRQLDSDHRDCTLGIAKTKALISFAVTAKLICVFVLHMQTSVRLMTRLICTIPTHTATGQLYVTVISIMHAITATGKLYAEAGYEYSSDRSSIRLKMYAPIKCP